MLVLREVAHKASLGLHHGYPRTSCGSIAVGSVEAFRNAELWRDLRLPLTGLFNS
jgi:hypothetical protein